MKYKIKKNKFFNNNWFVRLFCIYFGSALKFVARFSESCIYDSQYNDEQDINKLYGITDCDRRLHENSYRFGWRANDKGSIDIFAYWYVDHARGFKKLGTVSPNERSNYTIIVGKTYVHFYFNLNHCCINRSGLNKHRKGMKFILYPYFGGSKPAPHDMYINVAQL